MNVIVLCFYVSIAVIYISFDTSVKYIRYYQVFTNVSLSLFEFWSGLQIMRFKKLAAYFTHCNCKNCIGKKYYKHAFISLIFKFVWPSIIS